MINEHKLSNSDLFFNFTRMSPTTFEELVILMGPSLQRIHSRSDILSVGEILAATLRLIFIYNIYEKNLILIIH